MKDFSISLQTLTIFRHIYEDEVIQKLIQFFQVDKKETEAQVASYCDFVSTLYQKDTNFSHYLFQSVMNDENIVVQKVAQKQELSSSLQQALEYELSLLQKLSKLSTSEVQENIQYKGFLPQWESSDYNFIEEYQKRLEALPKTGYGIFAKYRAFCLNKHEIVPIVNPDPQRLDEMVGYKKERETVLKNTLAFLQGMECHNVLLYGDAGTGKSSTIKAIVNEYYDKGLRLIEVKKHQLRDIPALMDRLSNNPLRFILFIDDLSFESNDDNFIALKNILEGGIQYSANNIRVYATSNRRHFVKENMEHRAGSEVFRNDVIQETISLAARFGLTVTFQKPQKVLYEEIVLQLAKRQGLQCDTKELLMKAEAFAIRNNGRSPRTAKQFIELEKINEVMEGQDD